VQKVRWIGVLLVAMVLEPLSCGRTLPECSVEFAAYDRAGNGIENWQITGIDMLAPYSNEVLDAFAVDPPELRPIVENDKIYFRRDFVDTAPWLVKLQDADGESVEKEIVLYSCSQQRESVVFDVDLAAGNEPVEWLERKGRLKGCAFDEDWWVRSSPLFSAPPKPDPDLFSTFDAYVEPATGEFTIGARHGVRQLIVVGYGPDPVKVFAVNVEADIARADLGDFDLSDSCPATGK
jgi:hypothetical protein